MTPDDDRPLYPPQVVGALCRMLWPVVEPLAAAVRPPDLRPAGRRRTPDAPVFALVLDVLLNRSAWRGSTEVSRATGYRRFAEWTAAGLWDELRATGRTDTPLGALVAVVCRLAELRAASQSDTESDLVAEAAAVADVVTALRQAQDHLDQAGVTRQDLERFAAGAR